jgi:hypothetical protein
VVNAAEPRASESSTGETARLADALMGADLPAEAERHLRAAGLAYGQDAVAEQHLRAAEAAAPGHAAVLISLYRFYFYKGALNRALDIAQVCLLKAARENKLPANWRLVQPEDGEFSSYDARLPRFYLFTLKAYAYLQMRLGQVEEGRLAVFKLLELDPTDKVGARVLLDVLEAVAQGDDD